MELCSGVMKEEEQALEFIEYVTANADIVQKQVLAKILTRNAGVEYLQRHGLGGRTDTSSFKKLVPVITYEDIQPHINRIANGDKSPILCSHPISEFLTRSVVSLYIIYIISCLHFPKHVLLRSSILSAT